MRYIFEPANRGLNKRAGSIFMPSLEFRSSLFLNGLSTCCYKATTGSSHSKPPAYWTVLDKKVRLVGTKACTVDTQRITVAIFIIVVNFDFNTVLVVNGTLDLFCHPMVTDSQTDRQTNNSRDDQESSSTCCTCYWEKQFHTVSFQKDQPTYNR